MRLVTICAYLAISTFAIGQSKNISNKIGPEYEIPKNADQLGFFGSSEKGIVDLVVRKGELSILRFDPKTLNVKSTNSIKLSEHTKNFNSETVQTLGENYYWIHSDWEDKKEKLYYDKIDIAAGKIATSNQLMFEATKMTGSIDRRRMINVRVTNKYCFRSDALKKKLLIEYQLVVNGDPRIIKNDTYGFHVFDDNMNQLWSKEYTFPYTRDELSVIDYIIDSNGNLYILTKLFNKSKVRDIDNSKPSSHYVVFALSKDNQKMIDVLPGDYVAFNAALKVNALNEVVIAGLYSKMADKPGVDGAFMVKLGKEAQTLNAKPFFYEFPLEEMQKFTTPRQVRKMGKKDDYEAINLFVNNVEFDNNGNTLIACEHFFQYSFNEPGASSGSPSATRTTYFQGDIVATKIDSSGNLAWVRKIPKNQTRSFSENSMGYTLMSDTSGYFFIYLDDVKNLDIQENLSPYLQFSDNGTVMVSKIDNRGKLSKEILFDARKKELVVFPDDFKKINSGNFIGKGYVEKQTYRLWNLMIK